MAHRKVAEKSLWDSIEEQRKAFEDTHRFIKEQFYVVEQCDERVYNEYDYGYEIAHRARDVSPYFDTRAEAERWAEVYEPDNCHHRFVIQRRVLREHTVRQWYAS